VTLAEGFNAASSASTFDPPRKPRCRQAQRHRIRYYNIIYDLVDDVKKAMSGLLAPTLRETMLGNALILEVSTFPRSARSQVAASPTAPWNAAPNVRLIPRNVVVHEGKLSTLSASRTK